MVDRSVKTTSFIWIKISNNGFLANQLTFAVKYASSKVCIFKLIFSISGFLSDSVAFSKMVFSLRDWKKRNSYQTVTSILTSYVFIVISHFTFNDWNVKIWSKIVPIWECRLQNTFPKQWWFCFTWHYCKEENKKSQMLFVRAPL